MKTDKKHQIHFTLNNISTHLERTFQYWTIKKPSIHTQLERSAAFITSLIITVLWPIPDPVINCLLIVLTWTLLSLTNKKINRLFLLTNIMLNISAIFYFTQLWAGKPL